MDNTLLIPKKRTKRSPTRNIDDSSESESSPSLKKKSTNVDSDLDDYFFESSTVKNCQITDDMNEIDQELRFGIKVDWTRSELGLDLGRKPHQVSVKNQDKVINRDNPIEIDDSEDEFKQNNKRDEQSILSSIPTDDLFIIDDDIDQIYRESEKKKQKRKRSLQQDNDTEESDLDETSKKSKKYKDDDDDEGNDMIFNAAGANAYHTDGNMDTYVKDRLQSKLVTKPSLDETLQKIQKSRYEELDVSKSKSDLINIFDDENDFEESIINNVPSNSSNSLPESSYSVEYEEGDEEYADELNASVSYEHDLASTLGGHVIEAKPKGKPPRDFGTKCHLCGQHNHTSKSCEWNYSLQPCGICGLPGHASRGDCPFKLCFKCYMPGHKPDNCPFPYTTNENKICVRCGSPFHSFSSCYYDPHHENSKLTLDHIRCLTCRKFGHINCKIVLGAEEYKPACVNCGSSSHTAYGCGVSKFNTNTVDLHVTNSKQGRECSQCGGADHYQSDCPHRLCFSCNKPGHNKQNCPYAKGTPGNYKRDKLFQAGYGTPDMRKNNSYHKKETYKSYHGRNDKDKKKNNTFSFNKGSKTGSKTKYSDHQNNLKKNFLKR